MAGFFDYPTEEPNQEHGLPGFLNGRGLEDWAILLEHAETRRSGRGRVLRAGEGDRALYLLVEGWLRAPSGTSTRSPCSAKRRSWTAPRGRSASTR